MATLTVPASFFRQELRMYGDWREAFARELLQNSVDAGATRIDAQVETVDGKCRVVFADDGHGMTRRVLEDVFFALGRTTKTDESTIGGFGRARIITCFAQERYEIRTGNLHVVGEGGEYTLTETGLRQPGCVFTITTIDEEHRSLRYAFKNIVEQSSLTIPVYLNDVRVWADELPPRANRVLRDEYGQPWAKAYVKTNSWGRVLVSAGGLVMFTNWGAGSNEVRVELVTSRAREILVASRDRLRPEFSEQLDEFVHALSTNRRAAMETATPLDLRVQSGGFMATLAPTTGTVNESVVEVANEVEITRGEHEVWTALSVATPTSARHATTRTFQSGPATQEAASSTPEHGIGCDVFLFADTTNGRINRLSRQWNPRTWGTGGTRRKVLLAWKAAVAHCMDELVAWHPELGDIAWTVGVTFDEGVKAIHRTMGKGHVLALNPIGEDDTITYKLSDRASRRALLAVAAHEVCHVARADHDEDFAVLLTGLFARIDQMDADKAIRTAF